MRKGRQIPIQCRGRNHSLYWPAAKEREWNIILKCLVTATGRSGTLRQAQIGLGNCWKFLKRIPDHLTCIRQNLYADQEATVRTGHATTDWFQIRRGVHSGCILSPCLFNLYAEYIMKNTRLDEAQVGIKIARRNINNLRYADDTTLMVESEEELNLLIKLKEESKKC